MKTKNHPPESLASHMQDLCLCLEAYNSLIWLIHWHRCHAALKGAVLLVKHLDRVLSSAIVGMGCLEMTYMLYQAYKLGMQHGPTCFFGLILCKVCLHSIVVIKCRLQIENLPL